MEKVKIILAIAMLMIVLTGCASNENPGGLRLDGFSVGATYLHKDFSVYGQPVEVREVMPIGMLNFKFGK